MVGEGKVNAGLDETRGGVDRIESEVVEDAAVRVGYGKKEETETGAGDTKNDLERGEEREWEWDEKMVGILKDRLVFTKHEMKDGKGAKTSGGHNTVTVIGTGL